MTRTEIIDAAKQLVILHGPANIYEFSSELVRNSHPDLTYELQQAIEDEADHQARRIYAYLGYDSPWSK